MWAGELTPKLFVANRHRLLDCPTSWHVLEAIPTLMTPTTPCTLTNMGNTGISLASAMPDEPFDFYICTLGQSETDTLVSLSPTIPKKFVLQIPEILARVPQRGSIVVVADESCRDWAIGVVMCLLLSSESQRLGDWQGSEYFLLLSNLGRETGISKIKVAKLVLLCQTWCHWAVPSRGMGKAICKWMDGEF